MSSPRSTLRHGLPYGWWKRADFWRGLTAFVSGLAALALLLVILAAWFGVIS